MFRFRLAANGIQATDFEKLIDELIQSLQFAFHGEIEFAAIVAFQIAHQQSVQVESQGGDRGLEFVSHTINEIRLTAVQLNFLDGQERIERNAKQADGQSDRAQGQGKPGTLLSQEHNNNDHERNVHGRQHNAAPDRKLQMLAFSAKIGQKWNDRALDGNPSYPLVAGINRFAVFPIDNLRFSNTKFLGLYNDRYSPVPLVPSAFAFRRIPVASIFAVCFYFGIVLAPVGIIGPLSRLVQEPFRRALIPLGILLPGGAFIVAPATLSRMMVVDVGPREKLVNNERHISFCGWNGDRLTRRLIQSTNGKLWMRAAEPFSNDSLHR